MGIELNEVGVVYSTRKEVRDEGWDSEDSCIELGDDFSEESLFGLSDFSHVEVIFHMDKVNPEKNVREARHPRNRRDWPKVGIFAQRGKNRPNQLGLAVCEIKKIDGKKLFLKGLDAIDGTKILDIKPWVAEFAPRGKHRQPEWMTELMAEYWS